MFITFLIDEFDVKDQFENRDKYNDEKVMCRGRCIDRETEYDHVKIINIEDIDYSQPFYCFFVIKVTPDYLLVKIINDHTQYKPYGFNL